MARSIISEGKTTNEAIENGLKELKVSKSMVDIRVIENEDKRSFFSILTPRVVKVELTVKENATKTDSKPTVQKEKREYTVTQTDLENAKNNIDVFLNKFFESVSDNTSYTIDIVDNTVNVNADGDNVGFLIGYRGETLYAMQSIVSAVANRNNDNRVKVMFDIAGYKEKREKTLENLAERMAKTAIKTKKDVTLEPMQAYERKIIHSRLQDNKAVSTHSIGEEPHRRIVISLNK